MSFFDQLAGTAANPITSVSTPLVTGSNTVTLAPPVTYVGSSFLVGIWNFTGAGDTVNLATGTVGGQGFHGMEINDIVATGFTTISNMNGAVAVSGPDLSTPVELKSFSID